MQPNGQTRFYTTLTDATRKDDLFDKSVGHSLTGGAARLGHPGSCAEGIFH